MMIMGIFQDFSSPTLDAPMVASRPLSPAATPSSRSPQSAAVVKEQSPQPGGQDLQEVPEGLFSDPMAVLLLVFLAFPLLLVLLLAVRPQSGFRQWMATSLRDFSGLFSGIGSSRHRIHDQPYLDRVLKAEFDEGSSHRRRRPRDPADNPPQDSGASRSPTPSDSNPSP